MLGKMKAKGAAEDEMVNSITNSMDTNLSKLWEAVKDRGNCCAAVHGVANSWTQLSDWKTVTEGFLGTI